MSQKTENSPIPTQKQTPLLSPDREAVLSKLKAVYIRGDRQENDEKDQKMLNWTLDEIRKTCRNLPIASMGPLVECIKKVMAERGDYQGKIEEELKAKRELLKIEVGKHGKIPNSPESYVKSLREYSDMTKIPDAKFAEIGHASPEQKAEFIRIIEKDSLAMSKFLIAWENREWRGKLEKNIPAAYGFYLNAYDALGKKYDVRADKKSKIKDVQAKIEEISATNKIAESETKRADELGKILVWGKLAKIEEALKMHLSSWGNTEQIQKTSKELYRAIGEIRGSSEFQEFSKLAIGSKDPNLKNRIRLFNEMLTGLEMESQWISDSDFVKDLMEMRTEEKRRNKVTGLIARIDAAKSGIIDGKRKFVIFSKNEGNSSIGISEYESRIQAQVQSVGPASVNSMDFSNYLILLNKEMPSKLNYEYLRNKNFLTQFGIHWNIDTSEKWSEDKKTTKTQILLQEKDPAVLETFKGIIRTHIGHTFNVEAMKGGKSFAELENYIGKTFGMSSMETKKLIEVLRNPNGKEVDAIFAIARQVVPPGKIPPGVLQNIIALALKWFTVAKKVSEVEADGIIKWNIWDFLKKIESKTLRDDIRSEIGFIISKAPGTEKDFGLATDFESLFKSPKSQASFLKVIEKFETKYRGNPNFSKESAVLAKAKSAIQSRIAVQSTEALQTPEAMKAGGAILEKAQRWNDVSATMDLLKRNKSFSAYKEKLEQVVIVNEEVKKEAAKSNDSLLDSDSEGFKSVLTKLGFDPKFTREQILGSAALRMVFLERMKNGVPEFSQEESGIFLRLKTDVLRCNDTERRMRTIFGTTGAYERDARQELSSSYPDLASRAGMKPQTKSEKTDSDTGKRTASGLRDSDAHKESGHRSARTVEYVDMREIPSIPVGKRVRIDEDTTLILRKNGAVTIASEYSKETVPPEKAKIALGFISVAKIFPGLDFMGSLHEILQSHASHPLLSKMKDGSSNKERCDLVKFFMEMLGISGYDANAETPETLIQSINPSGKNFLGLARARWLLRLDNTIIPGKLGQAFKDSAQKL